MSNLQRLPDWAARLNAFIDEVKRDPFTWERDCATHWAAGAVLAITGEDVIAKVRGRHKTARGAMKAMKALGAESLDEAVALYLPAHDHPSQAQIGDIALIPSDGPFGAGLGIFNGETILVLTAGGMGIAQRSIATKAFKVG